MKKSEVGECQGALGSPLATLRYIQGTEMTGNDRWLTRWRQSTTSGRAKHSIKESTKAVRHPSHRPVAAITSLTVIMAVIVIVVLAVTSTSLAPSTTVTLPIQHGTQPAPYPVGTLDKSAPSGMSLPSPNAMPGYMMTFSTDFPGDLLPTGWNKYRGQPLGVPGAEFATAHVVVSGGLLRINTWRDPAYQNRWVTGGVCQCRTPSIYGAYFVRSRVTGGGATSVELLWPASNTWPPELDFNENAGLLTSTTSTVHFGPTNQVDQRKLFINMTKWHTWGVIWSPRSIKYVVDGVVWGTINEVGEIPTVPMRLDLQQQTACQQGRLCPTAPVSLLVSWVAEYHAT